MKIPCQCDNTGQGQRRVSNRELIMPSPAIRCCPRSRNQQQTRSFRLRRHSELTAQAIALLQRRYPQSSWVRSVVNQLRSTDRELTALFHLEGVG